MARKKSSRPARARRGRPLLLPDRVGLTVQLDGEPYRAVAELAERRGESLGHLVREALAAFLARQGRR